MPATAEKIMNLCMNAMVISTASVMQSMMGATLDTASQAGKAMVAAFSGSEPREDIGKKESAEKFLAFLGNLIAGFKNQAKEKSAEIGGVFGEVARDEIAARGIEIADKYKIDAPKLYKDLDFDGIKKYLLLLEKQDAQTLALMKEIMKWLDDLSKRHPGLAKGV